MTQPVKERPIVTCPKCGRQWHYTTEQAVMVERYGMDWKCFIDRELATGETLPEGHLAENTREAQTRRSNLVAGGFHNYLVSIQGTTSERGEG